MRQQVIRVTGKMGDGYLGKFVSVETIENPHFPFLKFQTATPVVSRWFTDIIMSTPLEED